MQIVINVSEMVYNSIRNKTEGSGIIECNSKVMADAIYNGIPLPKGHGRLIDADEIQFENTEFETYGDYCIAFDAIEEAPTVIEAEG